MGSADEGDVAVSIFNILLIALTVTGIFVYGVYRGIEGHWWGTRSWWGIYPYETKEGKTKYYLKNSEGKTFWDAKGVSPMFIHGSVYDEKDPYILNQMLFGTPEEAVAAAAEAFSTHTMRLQEDSPLYLYRGPSLLCRAKQGVYNWLKEDCK